jgi:hypothetical protein
VVLERRRRDHVLGRIRAGVLEAGLTDQLRDAGVGGRMDREGHIHHGFDVSFDKAPLKRLYIQARKQDTQLVMARRSMPKREKPTQQFKLFLPVKRDGRPPIGPGNHRAQNKQKNLVQWVGDLRLLARVIHTREVLQKVGCAVLL